MEVDSMSENKEGDKTTGWLIALAVICIVCLVIGYYYGLSKNIDDRATEFLDARCDEDYNLCMGYCLQDQIDTCELILYGIEDING